MNNIQDDFPLLQQEMNGKKLVYFDNSATTQKPKQVLRAMNKFYEEKNANVHRGIYVLAQEATTAYEQARQVVAEFINAQKEEIIFTRGTTESINALAVTLGRNLRQGDEIVLSVMEHHSNIVPWQRIATEKGAVLKFIPLTSDYRLDMDTARELITQKTKIVSITQMSNVLGTINPVEEVVGFAHAVGAICIIDGAQSAPHLPIDVQKIDCDFFVFSGHKICGPMGIGVLYGKKSLLKSLEPYQYGGEMITEVSTHSATWNELPWKFEAGTPNVAGAVGLAAAIEYLQKQDREAVQRHGHELTVYALRKLAVIPGVTIIGPRTAEQRGPIFSFVVDDIPHHDLAELLDKEGIALRGGHHCAMPLFTSLNLPGSLRASLYMYNTKEEIYFFTDVLRRIVEEKKVIAVGIADRNEITLGQLTEEQEMYKENVLDHYKNPHNKLEMIEYAFKHKEHNPLCGDEVTLYLKVDDGTISDVSFTGNGCAISQASISLLTDKLLGLCLDDAKQLTHEDVLEMLGIPISPVRMRCALLSLKTFMNGLSVNGL